MRPLGDAWIRLTPGPAPGQPPWSGHGTCLSERAIADGEESRKQRLNREESSLSSQLREAIDFVVRRGDFRRFDEIAKRLLPRASRRKYPTV